MVFSLPQTSEYKVIADICLTTKILEDDDRITFDHAMTTFMGRIKKVTPHSTWWDFLTGWFAKTFGFKWGGCASSLAKVDINGPLDRILQLNPQGYNAIRIYALSKSGVNVETFGFTFYKM